MATTKYETGKPGTTEALKKVEGIKSKLAKESNVKREGEFVKRPTRELVPGDVIFLRGGDQVPADCDYLAGDCMQARAVARARSARPASRYNRSVPACLPHTDRHGGADRRALPA